MERARAAATVALVLVAISAASALAAPAGLPPDGSQVNDDRAAGILRGKSGGLTAIVGGSLTAGEAEAPWIAFEQETSFGQQVFVRVFTDGAWTRSSSSGSMRRTVGGTTYSCGSIRSFCNS